MATPYKKPSKRELLDWQRPFNSAINQDTRRHRAEHLHLKNMENSAHGLTGAHRTRSPTTISAVVASIMARTVKSAAYNSSIAAIR